MMMRKSALFAALWVAISAKGARADLKVVATVPDLAALAKEVGGTAIAVKSMSLPTQDPHFVDARPSLALDLNRADLLLLVGMDLEIGWLPTLTVGARNARIARGARGYLDCSTFVRLLDIPPGAVDRSMGDIHPGGNPHYFTDPRQAAAVARGIAARLAELDPAHAGIFRARLDAFLARLDGARRTWEERMAPYRGTPIIGYHKTLAYFADWLGLAEAGFLEPKPGIPPSPAHVAHLLGFARDRKVGVIIQEDRYPDSASKILAEKIPAVLVRIPGGTNFLQGQTYIDFMSGVVNQLAAACARPR